MNEQEYLLAWSVYIAAALGLLLVCFRLTAWMWRPLRELLRLGICVLLFTPALIEQGLLAPSLAVVALDILKMGEHSESALRNLQLSAVVALALYLLWVFLRLFWHNLLTTSASPASPRASRPRKPSSPTLVDKKQPALPASRFSRIEPYL
ncbi:hypothetical protein AXE65_10220 [Ventosimonas gracilis]|uniref:Uncharacterized protein n=2 Tax=Ventosimonas gracilis TaxID=1680762 RepID=A0A139SWV7_9GAMM|nr:hypothetical protein AXE65_10220 [Ventosimonas gracilis]